IVGAPTNLNWSAAVVADVPAGVVTVMSTDWPAVPAGSVAVIWVGETTWKVVAGVLPNITLVAPVKLVPVIVTVAPPAAGPLAGDTAVMVTVVPLVIVNRSAAEVAEVPYPKIGPLT